MLGREMKIMIVLSTYFTWYQVYNKDNRNSHTHTHAHAHTHTDIHTNKCCLKVIFGKNEEGSGYMANIHNIS